MSATTEPSPAKVLVTGASGYLASHVVQQLLSGGRAAVRGTVRKLGDEAKVRHLRDLAPGARHPLELVEADLLSPDTWPPAVADMDYVLHVASPLPLATPRDENEVIRPAVEGTLNVLRACAKTPSVKRVVLTSSAMAVYAMSESPGRDLTEDDWSDTARIEAYAKSKTLAERAAWDLVASLPDDEKFDLVVLNPTLILGPPLHATVSASVEMMVMLLARQTPMIPRLSLPIIDVRDVALAHVIAMTSPEAAGQRIILNNSSLWMQDVALLLKEVFGPQGYRVPTTIAPKPLLWVASLFDSKIKSVLPHLGVVYNYSNQKMKDILKIQPRNIRETVVEMAYGVIEAGFVRKTKDYKGHGSGPSQVLST